MHIRINRDVLFKAFSHGQSVIERRTTLLILGHTLIQAADNTVTLISTDMDISLSEVVNADVLRAGSICIPTILVYEILRKMRPDSLIEMVFDEGMSHVILSAGRSKFEIPCISSDDFPRILQDSNSFNCNFTIPAPTLKNMIETVRFAVSNDEMRYSLNGINFSYDTGANKLRAVATDRHRLACVDVDSSEEACNMPSIIVGKKTIGEISKLLDEAIEPVCIRVSETRIELSAKFDSSSTILSSRLIDGSFPEYEAILKINHEKKVTSGTKNFAEAIDRVSTVINDKTRVIKINLSRNLLRCSAVGSASGSADEDIDVDYESGGEMELSFDVKYLLDIAQHIDSEEVEISLTNADIAVSIRPVGVEGVYFALMPLAPQPQY
jgi:DNA polymerase-3 subunit beta